MQRSHTTQIAFLESISLRLITSLLSAYTTPARATFMVIASTVVVNIHIFMQCQIFPSIRQFSDPGGGTPPGQNLKMWWMLQIVITRLNSHTQLQSFGSVPQLTSYTKAKQTSMDFITKSYLTFLSRHQYSQLHATLSKQTPLKRSKPSLLTIRSSKTTMPPTFQSPIGQSIYLIADPRSQLMRA